MQRLGHKRPFAGNGCASPLFLYLLNHLIVSQRKTNQLASIKIPIRKTGKGIPREPSATVPSTSEAGQPSPEEPKCIYCSSRPSPSSTTEARPPDALARPPAPGSNRWSITVSQKPQRTAPFLYLFGPALTARCISSGEGRRFGRHTSDYRKPLLGLPPRRSIREPLAPGLRLVASLRHRPFALLLAAVFQPERCASRFPPFEIAPRALRRRRVRERARLARRATGHRLRSALSHQGRLGKLRGLLSFIAQALTAANGAGLLEERTIQCGAFGLFSGRLRPLSGK